MKALNYRLELIENHLSEILEYDPTTLLTRFAEELRRADALLRPECEGGGWFFTHAKDGKGFQM